MQDSVKNKLSKPEKKHIEKKASNIKSLLRIGYTTIAKPMRFLNPFIFYNVLPHVYLNESERKIIVSLDSISYFKKVTNVNFYNNHPDKPIIVKFDDGPKCIITPQEYLISRLKSFGDASLNDWANLLENYEFDYKQKFQNFSQAIKDNPNCIDCLFPYQQEQKLNEFFRGKIGLWLTYIYTQDRMWLETCSLTSNFLQALGYGIQTFIRTLLREGLPIIYCADVKTYAPEARAIFEKLFLFNFKLFAMTKTMDLYTAQGDLKSAIQKSGSIVSPRPDGTFEVKHYLFYEFENDASTIHNEPLKPQEAPEFSELLKQNDTSMIQFLKLYYQYKDQQDIDMSKVCKYRELPSLS